MMRSAWQRILQNLKGRRPVLKARPARPLLEALEDRLVPANWFVSTLGSDGNPGSVGAPFATIQHAVNVAQSGDRIHVAQGVYGYVGADRIGDDPRFNSPGNGGTISGNFLHVNPAVVLVYDKSLQIYGGFDNAFTTWSPSTQRTIIDGGSVVRGVYVLDDNGGPSAAFNTPSGLDLEGITVEACHASGEAGLGAPDNVNAFGAGMWVNTSARPAGAQGNFLLKNMVFRGNFAQASNTGDVGGSAAGAALALRFVNAMTLDHVTFDTNLSQGGSGVNKGGDALGGGVHLDHSAISGTTVTLYNNRCVAGSASGGGISNGATADALGGGMAVQINSAATLTDVIALNNSLAGGAAANGDAGAAFGGAFYAEVGTLSLTNADIRHNVLQGGAGVNADRAGGITGGGGIMTRNSSLNLNQVQVINNMVTGGTVAGSGLGGSPGGGGLYLTQIGSSAGNTVSATNLVVSDNAVAFGGGGNQINIGGGGGGVWLQGVSATLNHATVANNLFGANLFEGQGILLLAGSNADGSQRAATATINYSIIANHTSTNGAAALDVNLSPNAVTLNRVLYANNSKDDNSDGQPNAPGTFNGLNTVIRAASAGFSSPGAPNYDYSLVSNSPAIGQGTGSSTTVDINNNPRTGTPDLGAYQHTGTTLAHASVALFDPETAIWQIRRTNAGGFFPDGPVFAYGSGGGHSKPIVGDWTGKGVATVGVVEVKAVDFSGKPFLTDANGNPIPVSVFELKNVNGPGVPDTIVPYGSFAASPVVGNWDNNPQHIDHIGVVEIQNGVAVWKLRNSFTRGGPDIQFNYGGVTSIPVVGNWTGSGVSDPGVVENTGGVFTWSLRDTFSAGAPNFRFSYGLASTQPIVGDWLGHGTAGPGLYDPSRAFWQLRNEPSAGAPDAGSFTFGPLGANPSNPVAANEIALAGTFNG
jgi:hypothetical protein